MNAVWPGTVVEEANLSVQISTLRRILDAGRLEGSCIRTVSGRGYQFVAEVTRQEDGTLSAPAIALARLRGFAGRKRYFSAIGVGYHLDIPRRYFAATAENRCSEDLPISTPRFVFLRSCCESSNRTAPENQAKSSSARCPSSLCSEDLFGQLVDRQRVQSEKSSNPRRRVRRRRWARRRATASSASHTHWRQRSDRISGTGPASAVARHPGVRVRGRDTRFRTGRRGDLAPAWLRQRPGTQVPVHRGAAVRQSEQRPGTGLLRRRDHRRPDHRPVADFGQRGDRAQ